MRNRGHKGRRAVGYQLRGEGHWLLQHSYSLYYLANLFKTEVLPIKEEEVSEEQIVAGFRYVLNRATQHMGGNRKGGSDSIAAECGSGSAPVTAAHCPTKALRPRLKDVCFEVGLSNFSYFSACTNTTIVV